METVERLTELLEVKDEKIEELENKLSEIEEKEGEIEWRWKLPFQLTEEENRDLPVPRLELHWSEVSEYNSKCIYSLIYKHLLGHIQVIPLGKTTTSATLKQITKYEKIDTPFRDGAHIKNDMKQLNLRGIVICGDKIEELDRF